MFMAQPLDGDDLLQVAHRHGPDVRFRQQRVGIRTNNGFHRGTRKNIDQRRKIPTARQFENPLEKYEKGELASHPEVVYLISRPCICKELIVGNGRERDFAVDKREAVVLNSNPFSNEE
ncbi:MAG TPA: hypothetical protein VD811_09140 [Desulfuromonadales bacterium]|nr:hypothetical protein [Desulfuromonadales bacterium]